MPQNNETILIVDDEPVVCEFVEYVLEREGYSILEAGNCYSALHRKFLHRHIDLLIADVALPDGTGWDLARQFLSAQPDLKVLFISGYTGAELIRQYGIPLDDIHFLGKPFSPKELRERVRVVLESPGGFPPARLESSVPA